MTPATVKDALMKNDLDIQAAVVEWLTCLINQQSDLIPVTCRKCGNEFLVGR
jgi:hypothetical protein